MPKLRLARTVALFAAAVPLAVSAPPAPAGGLSAEIRDNRVVVEIDGVTFTEYRYEPDQKYPYFFPVNGPASGKSVTTESSEPYPHHHSLFFGCDRVNGGNFWQEGNERGQIVPVSTALAKAEGDWIEFVQTCEWQRPDAPSPFEDKRTIRITAPEPGVRLIDFHIALTAMTDVRIEKTNHSLFSARMVPELSVNGGGALANANGDAKEEGTFGKTAPWCGYWGTRGGFTEGLAIFNHPNNPGYPYPWFTRDYGFFSPTPLFWLEDGFVEYAKREAINLRFGVLVHEGSTGDANTGEWYERWLDQTMAE